MRYKSGTAREQLFLFNNLEGCISSDNPVRLIDGLIDSLYSLHPDKFVYKGKSHRGCPPYSPLMLLKLFLYGYLNRISSSRRLETETHRNLELKWLLCDQHPDHKTISDYRKDNKEAIRFVTLGFRDFLRSEGYITGQKVTFDGTKVKACATTDVVVTPGTLTRRIHKLEEQIEEYLKQLGQNDQTEDLQNELDSLCQDLDVDQAVLREITSLRERVAKLEEEKALMKKEGRNSYYPNDRDAQMMKSRDGVIPAFNVQTGTDAKHKMIVTAEVTMSPNDTNLLRQDFQQLTEQTGIIPEIVLADKGYGNFKEIQAVESAHPQTECIIPMPDSPAKEKDKRNGVGFTYHPQDDLYTCTKNKKLKRKNRMAKHSGTTFFVYQAKANDCRHCPLFGRCTTSKNGRAIKVPQDHIERIQYEQRINTVRAKEFIKERKCLIEHVFGTMKRWMGKVPILLTSREKVQIEIDLYATAYNIRRLINITPMPELLEKLRNFHVLTVKYVAFLILGATKRTNIGSIKPFLSNTFILGMIS